MKQIRTGFVPIFVFLVLCLAYYLGLPFHSFRLDSFSTLRLSLFAAIAAAAGWWVEAKLRAGATTMQAKEDEIRELNVRLERRVDDKSRELRKTQEQVAQLQKLEAIGRLAGGVAHDFNNLITAILGTAQTLRENLQGNDTRVEEVEEIIDAVNRAGSLTRQLLAFSRRQHALPKALNLNVLIGDLEKMLRRLLGEDIELVVRLAPDLAAIKADPTQLEQILINLIVNAHDAMPKGGRLTIETGNMDLREDYARKGPGRHPGLFIRLTIADTGQGMDAETQAKIFEPFFTTKGMQGTGLGLATVYGIIKQNGGTIHVESATGRGTTFHIYWPQFATVPLTPLSPLPAEVDGRVVTETILLVEDEEMVRRVILRALQKKGYKVLQAPNGEYALQIGREYSQPIHLLLTDVVMPGINGRQLAEKARDDHPEMAVLYMSGYTADIIAQRGLLEPGIDFIEKSFTAESLEKKVREVLDKTRRSLGTQAQ